MARNIDVDQSTHALRILQRLDRMKGERRQCDFIVSVDGDEIHTHRNILSAGSDYFNAMLTHDTKESQLGKVEMMDVDSECVRICIDYIYTGKADIPDDKILALMYVARLMQLDELLEGIANLFENELNVETFYEAKEVAEFYSLENLLARCKEFVHKNFKLISSQPEFMNQPKKFVFDTISSKNLSATEQLKLIETLKWTRHDPERDKYFPDFVEAINLKQVSLSYRRHLIENESLIMENPHLLQIFCSSILDSVEIQSRNEEELHDDKEKLDDDENVVVDRIIIFDENVDGLQCFDVRNEEMNKFRNKDVGRFWPFTAVSLRSHIYILSRDKSVHRLSIADEKASWEKIGNMLECHGLYPPVVSHHGCLYVIGGSCGCCTAVSERYLPDENKWVRVKDFPNAIKSAALASLDEYIYSAGGYRNGRYLDTFVRFNPFKSQWMHLPPMTEAKCCVVTATNHKIYTLGGAGFDKKSLHAEVDCFDIVTSQWTSLTPMIESRSTFQAFCIDKCIYVFGGVGAGNCRKLIEKYDIEQDSWTKVKIRGATPSIKYAISP